VLILGDSLSAAYDIDATAGWVAILEHRLAAEYDGAYRVINASISGETSRGGAARIDDLLKRHRPAVVVVELGGNDGLRGIPLPEMRANLAAIIDASKAGGAEVVLVKMRLPPNYGPQYTGRFEQVYTDLADGTGVALSEFILAGVADQEEMMQSDGIHPTAEAQQRMLDNIWPSLKPLL
jgi:acyl-CoA thioesterase-1